MHDATTLHRHYYPYMDIEQLGSFLAIGQVGFSLMVLISAT